MNHNQENQNHLWVGSKMDKVDPATASEDEQALEALREILVGHYSDRVTDLQIELDQAQSHLALLEEQINDKDALVEMITPIMADSIRTSVRDSRDAMVDALYPIMGRLVTRAVTEAMQDLARQIDSQMRRTINFTLIKRRFMAQTHGISSAEMAIRDALPFEVLEIFLVHRETGILLSYLDDADDVLANSEIDSELISGMLTAIQDFVQDAFGRGEEENLEKIHYGDKEILIETTQSVYIAVVSEGIEPSGFRTMVREVLYEIDQRYNDSLQQFDGDTAHFSAARTQLGTLILHTSTNADNVEIDGQLVETETTEREEIGKPLIVAPKRDDNTILLFSVALIVIFLLIFLIFG